VAVRIRLRRIGKKKQPQYRLVVAEGSAPRDGRFIETIGHYNPRLDPPGISVNEERALAWLRQGAQPSDTAKSMLVRTGVWQTFTGEPPKTETPDTSVAAQSEIGSSETPAAAAQSEIGSSETPAAAESETESSETPVATAESGAEDAPDEKAEGVTEPSPAEADRVPDGTVREL
jgi:small subunit ribosomal protein S16